MKKLFRKLFGIKYTYFVVAEYMIEDRQFRSSCTATTDYPVSRIEYDHFVRSLEVDFRKRNSDVELHKFFIVTISRL